MKFYLFHHLHGIVAGYTAIGGMEGGGEMGGMGGMGEMGGGIGGDWGGNG